MPKNNTDVLSTEQFERTLHRKNFSSVYFFYGEEDFLIEEAVDLLTKAALDESTKSFNLDIVYGGEVGAKEVVALASSFPMMGERRVVIVRDFDKLSNKEPLLPYLESPSPSTCLVLISLKPDFRQKIFRVLEKQTIIMEFSQLYESDIPAWIQQRVKKLGKKITGEACQLMQNYLGRSLREAQNEIDKLFIYVGEKQVIDAEDVHSVVGKSKQYNIFELQKAIGQRNIGRSLEILESMLNVGESPTTIIVMLTRYFQKLWLLQELQHNTSSEYQLAATLRMSSFFVRDYIHAARKYSSSQIEHCIKILTEADETLKFTTQDPKLVMTLLLYELFRADQPVPVE